MIVTEHTRSGRIVTIDLGKRRGVTRTRIKGLCDKVAEQLRANVSTRKEETEEVLGRRG